MNQQPSNSGRATDKARAVKWTFFALLVLINAGLTSSFFVSNYTNAISIVTNPTANKFLTVVVGIILLDIGALAWLYLYENLSYTARARNVAQFMSWAGLVASTVASVAQLVLTNTLVALGEDVINGAGMVSLIGVAGILVAHVFAMMIWLQASPEARRLDAEMEARANEVERELAAEYALAMSVAQIANQHIQSVIPVLARIEASKLVNQFVTANGKLPVLENGEVDRGRVLSMFPELALPAPAPTPAPAPAPTPVLTPTSLPNFSLLALAAERANGGELISKNGNGNGNGHSANFTRPPEGQM